MYDSLPEGIQKAWVEANNAPPGGKRKARAAVINSAIKRTKTGKYEINPLAPLFMERVDKDEEKSRNDGAVGALVIIHHLYLYVYLCL